MHFFQLADLFNRLFFILHQHPFLSFLFPFPFSFSQLHIFFCFLSFPLILSPTFHSLRYFPVLYFPVIYFPVIYFPLVSFHSYLFLFFFFLFHFILPFSFTLFSKSFLSSPLSFLYGIFILFLSFIFLSFLFSFSFFPSCIFLCFPLHLYPSFLSFLFHFLLFPLLFPFLPFSLISLQIMFCHLRRISFVFFSPALSPPLSPHSSSSPPPPTLQLPSTLSLCKMGFRQAGSYQATGYMLIGSVSASLSLSGSCTGLTAVMYCWLLIAWSRGGSASSHYSIFRLNFCMGAAW